MILRPTPVLILALAWCGLSCVDTTPPWLKRPPRDAGSDQAQPTETRTSTATMSSGTQTSTATADTATQTSTATADTVTQTSTATFSGESQTSTATATAETQTATATATGGNTDTQTDVRTDTVRLDAGVDARPDAAVPVDTRPVVDVAPDVPVVPDAAVDSVPKPTAGLVAYYGFDDCTDTSVADLSGNKQTGTLSGQYSFETGVAKKSVRLGPATNGTATGTGTGTTYTAGYMAIPAGILSSASAMTVASWVRLNTNVQWQRIFDFGVSSATNYMFLTVNTPYTGGGVRFNMKVTTDAGVIQPSIDGPILPVGQWKHVAVVLDGKTGRIYVDGQLAAANTQFPLKPSDMGSTPNNWIGRSEFPADTPFDGQVDEFRVYNRALTPAEIAALAAP